MNSSPNRWWLKNTGVGVRCLTLYTSVLLLWIDIPVIPDLPDHCQLPTSAWLTVWSSLMNGVLNWSRREWERVGRKPTYTEPCDRVTPWTSQIIAFALRLKGHCGLFQTTGRRKEKSQHFLKQKFLCNSEKKMDSHVHRGAINLVNNSFVAFPARSWDNAIEILMSIWDHLGSWVAL